MLLKPHSYTPGALFAKSLKRCHAALEKDQKQGTGK
jgi:hypothetical protein